MYRADPQHTGVCTSDVPGQFELLWSCNTSAGALTGPVAAGGRIFAGSADGKVYALWADTGGEAWSFDLGAPVTAVPAVDGGTVYAVSESGRLCALGAAGGDLLWEAQLPAPQNYSLPLTLSGDGLFVASTSGRIMRVSTADRGTPAWTADAGSQMKGPVTVGDGQVFAIVEGGKAAAFDAVTGNQTWGMVPGFGTGDEFTSALLDGRLYFGTKGKDVYCINSANGSVLWSASIKSAISGSPALGYGMMVLGAANGLVTALEVSTGREMWSYDVGADVTISPSMAAGKVFLGNERGAIFMLNATTGQMIAFAKAGGSRISSPAISEGRVIFTTPDGGALAFGKPAPPRPVAGLEVVPARASVGDEVTARSSNSTGTPSFPVSGYLFDFGDGTPAGWSASSSAVHAYSQKGGFAVTLRVRDAGGNESETALGRVSVFNIRPTARLVLPANATAGRAFTLGAEASDPDGNITGWYWELGDNTTGQGAVLTHTFGLPGTYTVKVTVTDDNDTYATASGTLTALPAPVIRPPARHPGTTPAPVSLPVAAASVSCLSLLAIGAGLSLTDFGKYRFFTLFIAPLYVRLKKDEVLDNYVRGKIHGYIIANPGDHYNSIRDALELSNGIVAHHLHTLEREGLIQSMRDGMYRRFFPANAKLPPEDEGHYNIQKRIVQIIRDNPGISQKEIAQKVGVSSPTVSYHVSVLATARMIRVEKFGRRTRCFVFDQQPHT
jgi:outer membrane protein assembly factor BamB/DNA-binding MarR family transcriptional regulator